ncbi:hypothetical protein BH10PSE5_BH10PSE5_13890 [soil metagenome]
MRGLAILAALLVLLPARALAWDEVTHGHITKMAVAEVRDPELKAFLLAHQDEVQSGTWFPDWGHAIKPHGEATHSLYLDAAFDDLADPAVRASPQYDCLLAHYLGVYAHVVEDRVLDATLKKHAHEVGEGHRDDLENGMLAIAREGYLKRAFTPYLPASDFARIYRRAGYFGERRLDADTLAPVMARSMAGSMTLNRELKFLSFLASGEMARVYPWGAANIVEAPGGFRSNARAVAAGWEATWTQVHGRPSPFFVYALPQDGGVLPTADAASPYGRITIVARQRLDVPHLTPDLVRLTDSAGVRLPVSVFPYIDVPGHDTDLAFQIRADTPWRPGETYHLAIAPGPYAPSRAGVVAPFQLSFSAPTQTLFTRRIDAPRPWAMGIFLFVLVGGFGAMIFGAPDQLRLALREGADPFWLQGLNLAAKATGGVLGLLAFYLLWTNGAAFIDWLHFHH